MRFAIVGDIHISLNKNSEWEADRFVSLITALNAENYDGIIFSGDIFNSPRPSLDEISLFYTTLERLTTKPFILQGNHEALSKSKYTFDYLPKGNFTLMDMGVLKLFPNMNVHLVGHNHIKEIEDIDLFVGTNILVSHIRCNLGMIQEEIPLAPISKQFDYVILGDIHQRFKPFDNVEYTSQPYTSKYNSTKDTGYIELTLTDKTYDVAYKKLSIPNKLKVVTTPDKYEEVIKTLDKHNKYKVVVTGTIATLEGIDNYNPNILLEKEIMDSQEDMEEHLESIKNSGVINFESKILELTKTGYELTPSHIEKGKDILRTIFRKVDV